MKSSTEQQGQKNNIRKQFDLEASVLDVVILSWNRQRRTTRQEHSKNRISNGYPHSTVNNDKGISTESGRSWVRQKSQKNLLPVIPEQSVPKVHLAKGKPQILVSPQV